MKKIIKPTVYVLLPVFNRLKYTKKCLFALSKQNYKNIRVIIIDDGSTDGTEKYIKKFYPKFEIIKGDGNWWWTRSMYEGVKKAIKTAKKTDYILEMNNDCYFDEKYISQILETAKKHPNSIIGSTCVLANKPTKVVEIGIRIDWSTGIVYAVANSISDKLSYYKNMEIVDDIDALPGKGTLVPVRAFLKSGNFNYKKFPHYIADYEFAIRAKKHGFNLIVDTKAIVKHYWENTGISSKMDGGIIGYKHAFQLLFGRKSMNNIVDLFKFIKTCCPEKYKARNYYFLITKIFKAILSVKPFNYLRIVVKFIAILYHSLNYPKLAIYRTYLKIIQFPEYHLKK